MILADDNHDTIFFYHLGQRYILILVKKIIVFFVNLNSRIYIHNLIIRLLDLSIFHYNMYNVHSLYTRYTLY